MTYDRDCECWIAFDGVSFETQEACERHERAQRARQRGSVSMDPQRQRELANHSGVAGKDGQTFSTKDADGCGNG